MSFCIAKIKKTPNAPYRKITFGPNLYEPLDFDVIDLIPYDPDHRLDPESWFYLDEFRHCEHSIPLLRDEIDSKDYNELTSPDLKEVGAVEYICSVQDSGVYFQKITSSHFIRKKSIIEFGEGVRVSPPDNRIVLNSRADAIYHPETDRLIFKSLSFISSMFTNMSLLMKEATREQVENFLQEPFIDLANGFNLSKIGINNRKRITLARQRLEEMSPEKKAALVAYTRQYCENLSLSEDGNSFQISSDTELKSLLYALDERYYTTAMSGEKRLANSVKPVGVANRAQNALAAE